ncbi:unnamed protein product, partial [Tetraodon nigroviridis]
ERDQWAKKREYILASAGNIVGLGNVWRFPFLCFKNGGGVFLLPYCFFTLLCGLPLFLLETVVGQYTQEGAVTCWTKICPLAQGIGYYTMVIQIYFRVYSIVLAWAVFYLIYSFSGTLPWASCSNPWNTDRCVDLSTAGSGQLIINSTNVTKSSVSEFWEWNRGAGLSEVGDAAVSARLLGSLLLLHLERGPIYWKGRVLHSSFSLRNAGHPTDPGVDTAWSPAGCGLLPLPRRFSPGRPSGETEQRISKEVLYIALITLVYIFLQSGVAGCLLSGPLLLWCFSRNPHHLWELQQTQKQLLQVKHLKFSQV